MSTYVDILSSGGDRGKHENFGTSSLPLEGSGEDKVRLIRSPDRQEMNLLA